MRYSQQIAEIKTRSDLLDFLMKKLSSLSLCIVRMLTAKVEQEKVDNYAHMVNQHLLSSKDNIAHNTYTIAHNFITIAGIKPYTSLVVLFRGECTLDQVEECYRALSRLRMQEGFDASNVISLTIGDIFTEMRMLRESETQEESLKEMLQHVVRH